MPLFDALYKYSRVGCCGGGELRGRRGGGHTQVRGSNLETKEQQLDGISGLTWTSVGKCIQRPAEGVGLTLYVIRATSMGFAVYVHVYGDGNDE